MFVTVVGDVLQDSVMAYRYTKSQRKSGKTRRKRYYRGGGSCWKTQRGTLKRVGGERSGKELREKERGGGATGEGGRKDWTNYYKYWLRLR